MGIRVTDYYYYNTDPVTGVRYKVRKHTFFNLNNTIIICDGMTRVIGILAGKGGVGKTILTSNLAVALTELGQDVIAIDANMTTPHLGLQLGLYLPPKTLHDVLKGNARLKNVIYPHPLGFQLIPGSLNVNDLKGVDISKLPEVTLNLLGKADYVLMDCAPTLGREAVSALDASHEIIIITNPDLPSATDAFKTVKLAERMNKKIIGIVLNRVKGKRHELTREDVEEMFGVPVLAEIPEDRNVSKSIAIKQPLVDYNPDSPAAVEIRRFAYSLVGREFKYKSVNLRILDRLVDWLIG